MLGDAADGQVHHRFSTGKEDQPHGAWDGPWTGPMDVRLCSRRDVASNVVLFRAHLANGEDALLGKSSQPSIHQSASKNRQCDNHCGAIVRSTSEQEDKRKEV